MKRHGLATALIGSFAGAATYFSGVIPEGATPVFVLAALAGGVLFGRAHRDD